jgi:PIN domain nuclease of toxin-antitoxin system
MIAGVLDTHTILWFLANDPRLSTTADNFIASVSSAGNELAISSITFVELVYLIEKGRIPPERFTELFNVSREAGSGITEVTLNSEIARTMSRIDITKVPDMPDRIIAATGLHLQVPIVSKDGKIKLSGLKTIW